MDTWLNYSYLCLRKQVKQHIDLIHLHQGPASAKQYVQSDAVSKRFKRFKTFTDYEARVIARIVDGSAFDAFKPTYGPTLVTGTTS